MVTGINTEKLIKILRLACSTSEHEALTALGIARDMLIEAGLDWSDVIINPELNQPPIQKGIASDIENWLAFLLALDLPEKTTQFVTNLNKFYRDKGFLSPKQYYALRRTYCKNGGAT